MTWLPSILRTKLSRASFVLGFASFMLAASLVADGADPVGASCSATPPTPDFGAPLGEGWADNVYVVIESCVENCGGDSYTVTLHCDVPNPPWSCELDSAKMSAGDWVEFPTPGGANGMYNLVVDIGTTGNDSGLGPTSKGYGADYLGFGMGGSDTVTLVDSDEVNIVILGGGADTVTWADAGSNGGITHVWSYGGTDDVTLAG